MSERFKAKKHDMFDRWYVAEIRAQGLPLYDEADARKQADALNAAAARGELDAPKQQPVLYTRANGERVEDERKEDLGRCFSRGFEVFRREDDGFPTGLCMPRPNRLDGKPDEKVAIEWAGLFSEHYDRRAATAARDAVRASEPDERVGPKDRRTRKDERRKNDRRAGARLTPTFAPIRRGGFDRRNHTGTRADRREGGA